MLSHNLWGNAMLQITPQHRLLMADFCKGICGLKALCAQVLECGPFSGTIVVFTNRACTSVKLLVYDASGFWLCQKRFSQGKLAWWLTAKSKTIQLRASELQALLAKGSPSRTSIPDDWRSVSLQAANNEGDAWVSL